MNGEEGILDGVAVAVEFGELGYGLMLESAVEYLMKPGAEEKTE